MPAPRKPLLVAVDAGGPSRESMNVVRRGVRSVRGAAERIGMSVRFVRQLCDDGVLECFKVGRKVVIPVTAIDEYLAAQRDQYRSNSNG